MKRPIPDEEIVKRALRVRECTETDMEKYIREEHDVMMGAARIGMDAARKLWPLEVDHVKGSPENIPDALAEVLDGFSQIYVTLDRIGPAIFGELLYLALLGKEIFTTLEQEEERLKIGPRHEAEEAPPIGAQGAHRG